MTSNGITWVGMDAHKESIKVTALVPGNPEPVEWTENTTHEAIRRLGRKLQRIAPGEVRCCYEAGPTGYGLQRMLETAGVICEVVAPSLTPVKPGCRIKTDRRDARKLAELLRADVLTQVHPPNEADEAPRPVPVSRRRACRSAAGSASAHQVPVVAPLHLPRDQAPLGHAPLGVAELHDFRRFRSARELSSYVGLVPSEDSTGLRERRGCITKTGNRHVRKLLVEVAWHHRHRPMISAPLRKRREGQPARVLAIADRAQERLCARFHRMTQRGIIQPKAIVAVARELTGYLWAVLHPDATATRS